MKQKLLTLISLLLLSIFIFTSCSQPINWDENDFGAYFGFDTFDLSIDDIIQLEKDKYNIEEYTQENEDYGIFLTFEDNSETRYYRFDLDTENLVYIRFYLDNSLYSKFKNKFGNADIKNGMPFWYGYIGEQHVSLAGANSIDGSPWWYELDIMNPL